MSEGNKRVKKVAIIMGVTIELPPEAEVYFQSPNGVWYWLHEKPRVQSYEKSGNKPIDWTPMKKPIQIKNAHGFERVLVTEPPKGDGWLKTVCSVTVLN